MDRELKKIFITGGSGFIGTNLQEDLITRGHQVLNFDLAEPQRKDHHQFWTRGDIMNSEALTVAMKRFSPDWAVHLAARTECDENTTVEEGYQVNTVGTENFLAAVKNYGGVDRTIVTSSQFVCGPGRLPESPEDYFPHTVYGLSKVETEKLTRAAELPGTSILIRPVNIWGPYHERYCREFWKIAAMGLYIHPDVPPPLRTYGYVGNVVWQVIGLLNAPSEAVNRKVFYVGDPPIRIDRWSLGFSRELCGRDAPRVPMWLMKALATVGDAISIVIRRPFFLTSNRLQSMTVDYISPLDATIDLLGNSPFSLEEGIQETVKWYRSRKKWTAQ